MQSNYINKFQRELYAYGGSPAKKIYAVWESEWQGNNMYGMFESKESALRELHHVAAEKNQECEKMWGKESDDPTEDMYNSTIYKWDAEREAYYSKMASISIGEHELRP